MKPLVSIVIPAYNAENTIAYTLKSAMDQTWQRKEIIVIDDGSTDRTVEIVRRFAFKEVSLVSTANQGLSGAINSALRLCQGDYIQELDADDLLAPEKIERQLAALREDDSKRVLLSSPWAFFFHRTRHTRFTPNSLWQDLSPVEWLLRKMGENLHMQNATWLVSRELVEAAGPWDESLHYDQDGEYFLRVLLASEGTRFVPGTGIFYRLSGLNRISYIGNSRKKQDSLLVSIKLHIQSLRALEESERVRKACVTFLQNWYESFYPGRPEIMAELQDIATELHGHLEVPTLRPKYAWMEPIFGYRAASRSQMILPNLKASLISRWDKAMFDLERHDTIVANPANAANASQDDRKSEASAYKA